jgi:lactate dehydrogenase-like 2-hydroxyacid dehydrogenase
MPNRRLILTRRLPEAVEARAARDYDAWLNRDDRLLSADEIVALSEGADALLVCATEKFPRSLIERLPMSVRILSTFSAGTDHIDLAAARERGIRIGNAPHGVTIATAEIAMLLILGAARRAPEGEALVRGRAWTGWSPLQLLGRRLDGKVLGILGMGRIGQAVARRARAFDMIVHYHNRKRLPSAEEAGAVYHPTFDSLCAAADILSLNAPSTPETRRMVNARTIALMKPSVIIVNTARGDLVEDSALVAALKSGHVAYAGLDVFDGEPRLNEGYVGLPNTFLLPHMGSSAVEARNEMGFEALDNIDAVLTGREPPHAVA